MKIEAWQGPSLALVTYNAIHPWDVTFMVPRTPNHAVGYDPIDERAVVNA